MNVSKILISSAAVASVVGAFGLSYAQNINYRAPTNTTQTQNDAALPCQPGPFNPHLPVDPKARSSGMTGTSADCATPVVNTRALPVQAEAPMPARVVQVQSDAVLPTQTAPVQIAQPSTTYQASTYTASNDVRTMSDERAPRADRN